MGHEILSPLLHTVSRETVAAAGKDS